ncbi:heme peroxidase [Pikeienuella piscinae]|uniref:Heme peroxidase n=1 Tax=Pikeienuella piscinae TaxID=2748098 RepID=A0A7L5BY69_9RHOB|nr:peroxidase family protein [Pikeienuella piscinae]QIE55788.1 heme peroxidase [Pikeienuella piscinae]
MASPISERLINSILKLVGRSEWLSAIVNRILIGRIIGVARRRPHPFGTVHDYTSWRSLTDRTYSARHLESYLRTDYPPVENLLELFRRGDGPQRHCPKSTCLFPTFAQYLTDGFIRTETDETIPDRLKRNTSNHEIDLCPLYGRTLAQTMALRLRDETPGRRGRLKTQVIDGEEYAPFLFDGDEIAPEFEALDKPLGLSDLTGERAERRKTLFAFGGDRANSTPQVAMMNTLFLREHNRLAAMLEDANPHWDDDRVFETARNITIVVFIKIVVEDYINHIAPLPFRLRADPVVAWKAPWNRTNWITTEFSLLYRWHSLVPDMIEWKGEKTPVARTFMNNRFLIDGGLRRGFADMSGQAAGALGPFNTTAALLDVEKASILQGRATALAGYAAYRDYVSLSKPRRFEDISTNPRVIEILKRNYKKPEDIEFFVGLFAEDRAKNAPLPPLILKMVALDAFSQAMTNPLLSEHVFNDRTFSREGMKVIEETGSLRELVLRNTPPGDDDVFIGMTRPEWVFET